MTSFAFRETLMSHLLLWGNAYAQIIRNARGEIISLYPLMSNKITIDRDSSGRLFFMYQRGNEDVPFFGREHQVYLSPSDVLHIP
jgi:phage portal protein BeeE